MEANDGYIGEDPEQIIVPKGVRAHETKEKHKTRGLARTRHETVNNMIKTFKVLSLDRRYHHDVQKHGMCFRASAVLTQLALEHGTKEVFSVAEEYTNM